jgi:hypothetical protein
MVLRKMDALVEYNIKMFLYFEKKLVKYEMSFHFAFMIGYKSRRERK